LARAAAESRFTCDSLRLITLSAEPAFLDLVDEIERAFGVPAVVEYGSVECGFIAHECPDRVLRVREDMCLVETLPRDDGRYEIVVTVLNNPSFPLIRYAIEDVTDAPLHVPPAGFAVLQNVVGRSNDFLQGRTGKQVHPQGVKHVLEHCGSISRFRAHQDASGALALQVQFHGPISTAELGRMEQKLSELLDGYAASIEIVETMPTTLAGKHRWIISDLAPPMRIPSSKPRADRERELVTV
jgi:phenylacetate-CoA ligase